MVDELNEFDWEIIFDDVCNPQNGFDIFKQVPPSLEDEAPATGTANDAVQSWIEELLMNDDDQHHDHQPAEELASGDDSMWADLLVDSPQEVPQSSHERDSSEASPSPPLSEDKNSPSCSNSQVNVKITSTNSDDDRNYNDHNSNNGEEIPNFESNGENDKSGDDDVLELDDADHDSLSKKRKRQLRNRDAAMRSRERKKMYVKDLEMKCRYMEAECRRLGRLLQCCYAENQMLRISLGSAYGASMAKPESAVLSLESLLLVSLVWLMVNMCLLPLARLPLLNQDAVPHGSVERKELESAAPKGKGMKVTDLWVTLSFMRSKRCRASRIKMKSDFYCAVLCI